ncbi:putative nucleolus protein required for cell viability [Aspergillus heteromorphus CBS 117.55]|uniref:Putative nucleolus protein required for cell viability n=1 Tax=Aspergillus heteromorphus CBS 117.55 TaxID=1448321 RepID=A0A317UUJ5_9EURO|nr:putative nucleolus protein required for cell viability [Aspergillus heteromorphus CBS 117.55]PWY63710.1 putative nucleolus protein required for cell viability [Aspergillus heteromorphus CBS 117.55]
MTGITCRDVSSIPPPDAVGLQDQDIERLLFEAEDRLRPSNIGPANSFNTSCLVDNGLDITSLNIPKLASGGTLQPYVRQQSDFAVVDTARIANHPTQNLPAKVASTGFNLSKSSSKDRSTAGSDWFDLPKTELTPGLKRDLQLLRMRSVLDPKRHYKKDGGRARPPPYSQVGTIIEGPTEFFSSRIAKKDRKKSFVEEALAQERENKRFEAKYRGIQTHKQSGKHSFYKNLRAKRSSKGK